MKTILALVALLSLHLNAVSQRVPCDAKTGTAKKNSLEYTLNPYKNRTKAPLKTQIKQSITLTKILGTGDDTDRFKNSDAATVEGYVVTTKLAEKESCNCESTDPKNRDFHVFVARTPNETDKTKMIIVAITPKVRAAKGPAWSQSKIEQLKGHKVRFSGWMFFDAEHRSSAINSNPTGSSIERGTAWEIHPVTDFVVN